MDGRSPGVSVVVLVFIIACGFRRIDHDIGLVPRYDVITILVILVVLTVVLRSYGRDQVR